MLTVKKLDAKKINWSEMCLIEMANGNMMDADYTLRIYNILWEEINKIGLKEYNEQLVDYLIPMYIRMEYKGFKINTSELDSVGNNLEKRMKELYNILAGMHYNPSANMNSNADIADYLYHDEKGLCLYPPKRTKKDGPSTDAGALDFILAAIDEQLTK